MAISPDGRSLVGTTVRLDHTVAGDAPDLFAALDHDDVWASHYSLAAPRPRTVESFARDLIADPAVRVQYTVRSAATGEVLGTTSLGEIDLHNEAVHLGWTAYTPSAWGTAVNPECKYLLLRHVFEDCGLGRVKIQTDSVNVRSARAIAALGATREGVLRRHRRRADGTFRDTVRFSIIVDDWPAIKRRLERRLYGD